MTSKQCLFRERNNFTINVWINHEVKHYLAQLVYISFREQNCREMQRKSEKISYLTLISHISHKMLEVINEKLSTGGLKNDLHSN
ncbi:hypothetical protein Bhyg_07320 [Pseudolycoriella hygida]|uniref:Uncharacterized protein n=1 Tax=Pseudolycoriella hygida TaxID=35572 RepID=A0A9Q0S1W1_9DIPT|nr:hypothetical protein Bhyg_07320 [Pseudolycoriella hygida]